MRKIKLPIKMIWDTSIMNYAVDKLGMTVASFSPRPLFMYISDKGYIYGKDNAIEFGTSTYPFVEHRDFLEMEREEKKIVPGMYVSLLPKIPGGTTRIFKVEKENYNYLYDDEDHAFYRANYDITALNEVEKKLLRDMRLIR